MSFDPNQPFGGNKPFKKPEPFYPNYNVSSSSSNINIYQEKIGSDIPPGLQVGSNLKAPLEDNLTLSIFGVSKLSPSLCDKELNKPRFDQSGTKIQDIMTQKLMEKFGSENAKKKQPDSLNPTITKNMTKPQLKDSSSSDYNLFSTAAASMNYSGSELLSQSSFIQGKNTSSSSINTTFVESKDNQQNKGIIEEITELIEKNNINCIPLLNEVGSKVKKQVDTLIKEVIVNKNKQFHCTYTLGGEIIGFGKGISKIDAKLKAAEASIKTLLNEDYSVERAFIILSVHKKTKESEEATQKFVQTPSESFQSYKPTFEETEENDKEFPNDSSLYQLNLICKMNFIEPRWTLQKPTGSSDYEAQVSFNELSATGKGSRKLDAKRNAAAFILEKIKNDKDLKKKYDITNKPSKKKENKNSSRQEKIKQLFEQSMSVKMLSQLQEQNQLWIESIKKSENEFDAYLQKIINRFEIKEDTINSLIEFFKQISTFTENLNSPREQDSSHISNYISNCSLTLIGSFALDCMHQDKLSIDAALIFQGVKKISELELLHLYQKSLIKSQEDFLNENPNSKLKMKFNIEKNDRGYSLSVISDMTLGHMKLNIQVSDPQTKSCKLAIHHVKRIYDCCDQSDHLNKFRGLMMLMRLWRAKNNLQFFPPELLDAALLNVFLTNPSPNISCIIQNTLAMLNSAEGIFKAMLEKFGPQYLELYNNIPQKLKYKVISLSGQSLEEIHTNDFSGIFESP